MEPQGTGIEMKKKTKAANVVPFTGATDEPKAPPSKQQILDMLVAMDEVEFERGRLRLAAEWGIRVEALDRIWKEAERRHREYGKGKPDYPEPDPDEHWLKRILNTEGILDLWLHSWDKVMAGEHRNAKLIYLIATSRFFDDTMHAAIKGPSSGGKSQIRKQVLKFFPAEDIIAFTTISEKALLYDGRNYAHKILSMDEVTDAKSQELQDMLLRVLMSEGVLRHNVTQFVNGVWRTDTIIKEGPVVFMVTTTKATLHPENETRMISLEIDDSEAQTRRVLKKQAQTLGKNIKPDEDIYLDWEQYQRFLRMLGEKKDGWKVVVPFAPALAALIPPRATRLRRDYPQIIACIKSHTVLHCYRRENNEKGELVADLELDYAPVADLIGHIASEGAGIAVSKELIETINAVKIATADPNMPKDDGATAFQIGKLLHLDKSAARRRLLVAEDKGFVANLEQRRFQPGKYRLTDQEVEAESLLPTVDEIRAFEVIP
jgi:hypothetical protein